MKKICVTGANGFIGKSICNELIKQGKLVRGTVRSLKTISEISNYECISVGDIDSNTNWSQALTNCDCVIHCAGLKAIGESVKEPITYIEHNVGSTLSLLDCMMQEGVYKIIFSSSASVYDAKQSPPWKEQDKIGNTITTSLFNLYAVIKSR